MCPKKAFIPLMSRIGSTIPENITHAKILAEYIALLHVPHFLKSLLIVSAPRQDQYFWKDVHVF